MKGIDLTKLSKLPTDKLKYVLGIAEAGIQHEGWSRVRGMTKTVEAIRAELKRRKK
jgi:hypothetical protein